MANDVLSIHGRCLIIDRILLVRDASDMASPKTEFGAYTARTDSVVLEAAFK